MLLLHFRYSVYAEKIRWALDHKGIEHRREALRGGPHTFRLRRLTGQTKAPVIVTDDEVVWDSPRILDFLETHFPDPPLLPPDPDSRARCLEIERHFDQQVGEAVRAASLMGLVNSPAYLCRIMAIDSTPWFVFYRLLFPFMRPAILKSGGVRTAADIEAGMSATERAFDEVASLTAKTGYIVGDQFTHADLCAASILAGAVDPPHPDMQRPGPLPPAMQEFLDHFARHPGAEWVRRMYAQHRGPPAGASPSLSP